MGLIIVKMVGAPWDGTGPLIINPINNLYHVGIYWIPIPFKRTSCQQRVMRDLCPQLSKPPTETTPARSHWVQVWMAASKLG